MGERPTRSHLLLLFPFLLVHPSHFPAMVGAMTHKFSKRTRRALDIAAALFMVLLLVFIVWLDITSGVWAETVILSGIAAGILTFFLTALFIERWMAAREHRKWSPVTRLALTDILHTLADDEHSDIRRGHIVPRTLSIPDHPTREQLDFLLHEVVRERDEITAALARWAQFLAASADVQDLMNHIADLAESLDNIRDCVVELESGTQNTNEGEADLHLELATYAAATDRVITEISSIQDNLNEGN